MSDEDQELTREEEQALRRTCSRFLTWHGLRSASDVLSEIPPDVATDVYGEGGVGEELEDEIASLLGKPAAAFLPSGVRSQQIALRVHAARLWGCESFYGRTFRDLREPFDTVYVSFYKQLGGLPGSGLAGPGDVVAEVRECGGATAARSTACGRTPGPR